MIRLEYFTESDFNQLINWIESPEFMIQWSGSSFNYPLDVTQLSKYIEKANQENSEIYIYKVIHNESNKVIGHLSLGNINKRNNSARIGRVLVGDQSVRGLGIGQKMIEELLKIAFEELHLHRVSLGVFDFNHSAISCYEKAGFVKEGLLRDHSRVGNQYWNLFEMSILENEWSQKKLKEE
ncbi:GNAT family N-acetyltransferase [Bacillus massilinigeriensis]|uniref:GNAT family N-acetyltransferase n=1 Tax=Bacillus massilionigeriensis TaxID=1805475 RepID=UPI00096B54F2|nr:GNAT family protein [Bacillus massilionigeriensis]